MQSISSLLLHNISSCFATNYLYHHSIEHFSFSPFITTVSRNIIVHKAFSLRFKLLGFFSLEVERPCCIQPACHCWGLCAISLRGQRCSEFSVHLILNVALRTFLGWISRSESSVREAYMFKSLGYYQIFFQKAGPLYISTVRTLTSNCHYHPFYFYFFQSHRQKCCLIR